MTKTYILTFLAVFSALSFGLILSIDLERQKVYPYDSTSRIQMGIAHEEIPSNWSEGNYFIDKDSNVHFNYTLTGAVQEPFVGLYFHRQDSTNELFMDFSEVDQLSIHLSSAHGKRIPVFLTLDYKGFTKTGKSFSWVPLSAVIEYKGEATYSINKHDFEIPSWWLRLQQLEKEDFKNLDFSRVSYIVVNSCQTLGPGKKDELILREVYFSHNNRPLLVAYTIAILFSLAIIALVYFIKGRKKVLVPYKVNELEEQPSDSKIALVKRYMAQHYANPELSAQDLQLAIGITEREIGLLIKNQLSSSFKSYLNAIRLSEVKRMLLQSDKPVSEIAYLTGYNNIPHFNRVFKKEFECTPKEFREKNK